MHVSDPQPYISNYFESDVFLTWRSVGRKEWLRYVGTALVSTRITVYLACAAACPVADFRPFGSTAT